MKTLILTLTTTLLASAFLPIPACLAAEPRLSAASVERWGLLEISLPGPSGGNPFADVRLQGIFEGPGEPVTVDGFYDGDGVYRIRFSPERLGRYTVRTQSNRPELDGATAEFTCVAPSAGNHGPVRVVNTHYLAYADGTPYFQIGTTCYAWIHQTDALQQQTLETLKTAPFNKMRMCVFPKDYTYNKNEPPFYPFEGKPLKDWDYTRLNPEFFRHLERRILDLQRLGIEADLILLHPYDRWGYANMTDAQDDAYLRYLVARVAAYRNVWWSFANEYDLMKSKTMDDWDRMFQLVARCDPYRRMAGIHNCRGFYDHTKPWVTHCSIQSSDLHRTIEWRNQYNKPVLFDECKYEGDVPEGWGNLTAEQMTDRFWLGTISGAYVGHGETYKHPRDILWWSKGGVLHGQSPARIAFFKQIMADVPFNDMQPTRLSDDAVMLAQGGRLYFVYLTGPSSVSFDLPGPRPYKLDAIDTWAMTTTPIGTAQPGKFTYTPPRARSLIRLTVYAPGEKLRPQVKASAAPTEGLAPLTVRFSTDSSLPHKWDFGDGQSSTDRSPTHTYATPGVYSTTVTVTDADGAVGSAWIPIVADRATDEPVVRFAFPDGDRPKVTLHGGPIQRSQDGVYTLASDQPFKWVKAGDAPVEDLEAARSFTITGWLKPAALTVGSGGNRILFTLQHNRSGIDLVHHADGRMRLAVNQWPDGIQNDSSPGKLVIGRWTFFAVTYDSTRTAQTTRWYFGDAQSAATLDRTTDYNSGPVGTGGGNLVFGNFNETLQSAGLDRQFRGQLARIQIFTSRISNKAALSLETIQRHQQDTKPL